jgi:excisionase family DNA binding protein
MVALKTILLCSLLDMVLICRLLYFIGMSEENELPTLPGYVTIKEAAEILGIHHRTVQRYVADGLVKGVKAGTFILIPEEEVHKIKPKLVGKPRTSIPLWRISSSENSLLQTTITVRTYKSLLEQFYQRLEEIRDSKTHLFPGTVARYISTFRNQPDVIEIHLIWRAAVMPDESAREAALEAFREATDDVIDWETADYDEKDIRMHT